MHYCQKLVGGETTLYFTDLLNLPFWIYLEVRPPLKITYPPQVNEQMSVLVFFGYIPVKKEASSSRRVVRRSRREKGHVGVSCCIPTLYHGCPPWNMKRRHWPDLSLFFCRGGDGTDVFNDRVCCCCCCCCQNTQRVFCVVVYSFFLPWSRWH